MKKYLLIILICTLPFTTFFFTKEEIKVKVIKKENITSNSTPNEFLVHTENELLINNHDFLIMKFNQYELQQKIKTDTVYTFEVIGFKLNSLGLYRNIIEIK